MKSSCTACNGTGRFYEGTVVRPCKECGGLGQKENGVYLPHDKSYNFTRGFGSCVLLH